MLIALLHHQEADYDVTYETLTKNNFPIDFTSTTMEAVFPGLTDEIGFDVPLNLRFVSRGAPRILFQKDELELNFNFTL